MHRPAHPWRPLGAAALALLALLSPPAGAASRNLLPNPGFEESLPGHPWMPTVWDTSRAGISSVFFGRDTMLAHGGRYAATVANVSAIWPFSHNWSQTVILSPQDWGKDAVFSVWTLSAGIEGRAYILLQAYRDTLSKLARAEGVTRDSIAQRLNVKPIDDPAYDLGWKRQCFSDPETGWVRREVRIFIPPLTHVLFVRCGLIGTGQLVIDDASLTLEAAKSPPPARPHTNLLVDPDFENGGLDWEFSVPPYRNAIGRLDSTQAHSGRVSAMFTGGEQVWVQSRMGACQAIMNRNLQGKRLRMTGWIKTDSLATVAYTKFYFNTLHGVVDIPTNDQFAGTVDWHEATLEADVPKDAYEVWVWYMYNGPAKGIVHVDDCSVEVIGEATGSKITARKR